MEDRSWMYQRKTTFGRGMNPEFVVGVYKFLEFATSHCNPQDGGEIRCPCSSCKNKRFYHKDIIISHLYRKGFVPGYTNWSCHGEPNILLFPPTQTDNMCGRTYENSYHEMVMDCASSSSNVEHSTKHTGGSISFPEHELRMKQQKGESYEYHELWDSLHIVHKEIPNKGQFIDQRAKKPVKHLMTLLSSPKFHQVLLIVWMKRHYL